MKIRFWPAFVCLLVVALGAGGIWLNGDPYDTRSPIYGFIGRVTPPADLALVEAYGDLMRTQDYEGLKRASAPGMLSDEVFKAVPRIAGYYPAETPKAVAPIQYALTASSDGNNTAMVTVNHVYSDGVVLTVTKFDQKSRKVTSFTLRRLTAENMAALRFDPLSANSTQLAILGLACAVFAFTLITLYSCLAAAGVKWKWLWFLFITAGVCSLRFNWMTSVMSFAAIDIRWGAAGYWQNLLEPAMVYINFPLGAVVYWLFGRRKAVTKPVSHPEF